MLQAMPSVGGSAKAVCHTPVWDCLEDKALSTMAQWPPVQPNRCTAQPIKLLDKHGPLGANQQAAQTSEETQSRGIYPQTTTTLCWENFSLKTKVCSEVHILEWNVGNTKNLFFKAWWFSERIRNPIYYRSTQPTFFQVFYPWLCHGSGNI